MHYAHGPPLLGPPHHVKLTRSIDSVSDGQTAKWPNDHRFRSNWDTNCYFGRRFDQNRHRIFDKKLTPRLRLFYNWPSGGHHGVRNGRLHILVLNWSNFSARKAGIYSLGVSDALFVIVDGPIWYLIIYYSVQVNADSVTKIAHEFCRPAATQAHQRGTLVLANCSVPCSLFGPTGNPAKYFLQFSSIFIIFSTVVTVVCFAELLFTTHLVSV